MPEVDTSTKAWWCIAIASFFALVALTASLPLDLPSSQEYIIYPTDSGSTAWMLVCAVLGFFIGPIFAYFAAIYRGQEVKKALIMAFVTAATVTMMWILFTYSLVWGGDAHGDGILGWPKTFYMFHNTGAKPDHNAPLIPSSIFAIFELAFAILTPTIVGIYMLERINLKGWILFTIIWHTCVWCPVAHITWEDEGFLKNWRIIDFSGGIVVNICSAATMLAGKVWWDHKSPAKYESTNTVSDKSSIWSFSFLFFTWFAIHAGKAHAANSVAAQSIVNTFAGVMASWFTCILLHVFNNGDLKEFGYVNIVNSSLIALVALVPASGFVTVGGAMVIAVFSNLLTKFYIVYNDNKSIGQPAKPICAFTLHGVTGTLGFWLTAILSYKFINPAGENGLTFGVGETWAYHICVTLVLWPMIFLASFLAFWVSDKLSNLSEGIVDAVPAKHEPVATENKA
jgi:Amt family ammonium transporter